MQHPPESTLPESMSFSQSQSELAGYLCHLDTSTFWTFRGHRYVCGAADNKTSPRISPKSGTGVKPNVLDGMVFRFNPFMFKNPGMQAYLMSVIASDPAAETIKESVKNQRKGQFMVNDTPEIRNDCVCRKNRGKAGSGTTKKEQHNTVMKEERTGLVSAVLRCLRKTCSPRWRP